MKTITRRSCLKTMAAGLAGLAASRMVPAAFAEAGSSLTIALGEYSFNTAYRAGKYNPLDLADLPERSSGSGPSTMSPASGPTRRKTRRFFTN